MNKPVADEQLTKSVTTASAIAERDLLIVKLAGQLAEYEQKLRNLVEVVEFEHHMGFPGCPMCLCIFDIEGEVLSRGVNKMTSSRCEPFESPN